MNYTPDFITNLSDNEIFVFGSNIHGMHGGGAAKMACRKFGAEWGVGVGKTGQCYAIPTMHGGIEETKPFVDDFIDYAKEHVEFHFLVTRIGCGIAGFTDMQMAPLFDGLLEQDNVSLPREWVTILKNK